MFKRRIVFGFCMVVLLMITGNGLALNESDFATPPDSAKPWVYWYWMNGNATKEGVQADLEAMKNAGIGGAMQFDIGMGPRGPLTPRSQAWLDVIQYTLTEAEKRDIKIGFNCPGWCNSGGPWITPEYSMQELAWSETFVEGPRRLDVQLKEPARRLDTYQDIAVVAFPTIDSDARCLSTSGLTIKDTSGKVVSHYQKMFDKDGDTTASLPGTFEIELDEPMLAQSMFVYAPGQSRFFKAELMAWDEKSNAFVEVTTFRYNHAGLNDRPSMGTASFDPIMTRRFRLAFSTGFGSDNRPAGEMHIAELEITSGFRLNCWANKAGFGIERVEDFSDQVPRSEDVIALDQVQDLTSRLRADGTLNWKVPEGKWTILRLGYIPTGAESQPLPAGIQSLEADKLRKQATDVHYDGMMKPLLALVGPEVAKNVFANYHDDSFEVGWQNWSDGFENEFEKRRGYSIDSYLPALTGRVVGDVETTERFLWDFRRTIADCYADYHITRLSERCREDGLYFSTEGYDGPFEYIQANGRSDVPMLEIWATNGVGSRPRMAPIHAGHIYERQIIATEQFTSPAKWESHPYSFKPLADYSYTVGVNRFAMHVFTQQPWADPKLRPGMTLGPWGAHVDRGNVWWDESLTWHQYLARCQYILQQGSPIADILYFLGEDCPDGGGNNSPVPPTGYDGDALNAEILWQLKVADGKYVLPKGKSYRYIVLSDDLQITLKSMQKLQKLVRAGGTLIGHRPDISPSLADYMDRRKRAEFADISESLWGSVNVSTGNRKVGRGRVIWGKDLEEILSGDGLVPDFAYDRNAPVSLNYTHRVIDDADVYFVASSGQVETMVNATFRVTGKKPELWYPDSGQVQPAACYKQTAEGITVPLKLDPAGSVFVVFRKSASSPSQILTVKANDQTLINADASLSKKNELAETFTLSFWANTSSQIVIPQESASGLAWDDQCWAYYPAPGHQIFGDGYSGVGVSVGTNGICVMEHFAYNVAPVLVYKTTVTPDQWIHIAVVYKDNKPTLYLNGKPVHTGQSSGNKANFKLVASAKGDVCKAENLLTYSRVLDAKAIRAIFEKGYKLGGKAAVPEIVVDGTKESLNVYGSGVYEVTYRNGRTCTTPMVHVPDPLFFDCSWKVYFPSQTGPGKSVNFATLHSWAVDDDPDVKYFSGTAIYTGVQDVPSEMFARNRSYYLSLGDVQVIAEVIVNGKNFGVYWKPPFLIDISSALAPGKNTFEIRVTNTWPNRLIGDERFPDDCTRDGGWGGGQIPEIPDWVTNNQPRPESNRVTFTTWKHWLKDDPLKPAGMLGPVKIVVSQRVKLD